MKNLFSHPKAHMLFNTVLRAKCTPNVPWLASYEHWESKHLEPLNIYIFRTISRDSRRKRCCDACYIHSYRSETERNSKKQREDKKRGNH